MIYVHASHSQVDRDLQRDPVSHDGRYGFVTWVDSAPFYVAINKERFVFSFSFDSPTIQLCRNDALEMSILTFRNTNLRLQHTGCFYFFFLFVLYRILRRVWSKNTEKREKAANRKESEKWMMTRPFYWIWICFVFEESLGWWSVRGSASIRGVSLRQLLERASKHRAKMLREKFSFNLKFDVAPRPQLSFLSNLMENLSHSDEFDQTAGIDMPSKRNRPRWNVVFGSTLAIAFETAFSMIFCWHRLVFQR